MRRSVRGIALWLLASGLLGGLWHSATAQTTDYQQELDAAKRAGLPIRPADLKAAPPPESQNAAPLYRQLDRLLKAKPEDRTYEDAMALLARTPPTAAQTAKARALLAQHKDILALIHQAAARPKCDFQRDWAQGPAMLFPEYAGMRAAARWLTGESGLLLRDGKPIEAVRNMALGFRIADHAASDPILIAYLVSVAIDSITLRGLENILYAAGDRPGVAEAVQQTIERGWRPHSLAYALRGEAVMSIISLEDLRRAGLQQGLSGIRAWSGDESPHPTASGPLSPAARKEFESALDASGAYIFRALRQMTAVAGGPYPQARSVAHTVSAGLEDENKRSLAFAAVIVPLYDQLPVRRAHDQAMADVVRAAAAGFAWKAKHGAFPGRLEQALKPVPSDPFDGKSLRYRREGQGFVIYSIGETGRFEGVAADSKQHNREALFRYPMPTYLKQPPPAAR